MSGVRPSRGPQGPAPGRGEGATRGRGRSENRAVLEAWTGQPVSPRDTRGGEFFYRVHFQMHYLPVLQGRWVAGLCAMFMLVAITSGVVTHKQIFKDFFTFRPRKAAQRSWLDAHNLTAVLALPFHPMNTHTGLATPIALSLPFQRPPHHQPPDT